MPKIKDNDHIKMTVVLSPSELEAAQAIAIKVGFPPKIVGNTSAFLRMVVNKFTQDFSSKK